MHSQVRAGMFALLVPTFGLTASAWAGEILQLTSNDLDDLNPAMSSSLIAWQGEDGSGDTEIYLYDRSVAEISALTDNDIDDANPAVYGGRVAWQGLDPVGGGRGAIGRSTCTRVRPPSS